VSSFAITDTRPYDLADAQSHFLIYLRGVTAVFDGFKALDINAWGVYHNELRVVIGPNGAGKTTLCDVISGKTKPTTGQVYFNGNNITGESDSTIARMGVGRKFQTPTVFDSLTVYQNMELALPERRGVWRNLWAKEKPEQRDRIHELLERVRLIGQRNMQAKYLSHGQRQWLEISMLILASPTLLLVDEPAAGLTDAETDLTAELLLELKESHTLIVIEHDMDFVRRLGAWVTVLNEGKVLADGPMDKVQADEQVIEAYLGR
jgi:urea transport system ATP-binding protein